MPPITTTRPMTEEERAYLREPPLKLFGWYTGIVSAVCTFLLIFLVASLLVAFFPFGVVVRGAFAAATLGSVAWYVRVQRKERRDLADRVALTARELDAGYVQSTIYRITDAVAVEEQEDEGISYYLLLDDGRTLFLSGQYLYGPAEDGFPWKSFEVLRVPPTNWVLRVVPLGPPVTPSRTRGPFSEDELSSSVIPADGAIEQQDFDALKAPAV